MKYFLLLCLSYLYLNANAHIFIYHRFGDSKHESTNTSLEELEKEFIYFKNNGYEVVPLTKIIDKLKRKEEIAENEFYDTRDPKRISHLTELKNIRELLELIYIQAREQRKISEKISE